MTRLRKRKKRAPKGMLPRFPVELVVTYNLGRLKQAQVDYDIRIRKALGIFSTGSGFCLLTNVRDFSAEVSPRDLDKVLTRLRAIKGIKVRKLVKRWETVIG